MSNVPNSVIENSNLRNGLEFIYSTANSFIDSFKITFPNELFQWNASTIQAEELSNNLNQYFESKDSNVYFNKVFRFQFHFHQQ